MPIKEFTGSHRKGAQSIACIVLIASTLVGVRAWANSTVAGPIPRTMAEVTGDEVNVRDFGAIGNGQADDTRAINAAIEYLRNGRTIGGEIAGRLVFPQGRYLVRSTINLSGIRSRYVAIDGGGSVIVGRTSGTPVVDALGTRYLRINDISIEGEQSDTPSIGIQIGRTDATERDSSDNIEMDAVIVSGFFTFTALYNLNAETSMFSRVNLWNSYEASNSFSLVQDGLNHFGAHSAFVTEKAPAEMPQSFNENLFINVDIRHFGGGTPIWMAQTSRHQFINGYVANTKGPTAIDLYSASDRDQNLLLDLDLHVETSNVKDEILITGPNRKPILTGLRIRDHYSFASRSLLNADAQVTEISLVGARVELGAFASSSARVFAQPALWTGSADVWTQTASAWNGTNSISTILASSSNISINTAGAVATGSLRITGQPPKSAGDRCSAGQIAIDPRYIYVCAVTDVWMRAPLQPWH